MRTSGKITLLIGATLPPVVMGIVTVTPTPTLVDYIIWVVAGGWILVSWFLIWRLREAQ